MEIDLGEHWYAAVAEGQGGLLLDGRPLPDDTVLLGAPRGPLTATTLRSAARNRVVAGGTPVAPLAALAAFATGDPAPLRPCFPLTRTLDPGDLAAFDALAANLARSGWLDLRLFDTPGGRLHELPVPADAALLVAGHLTELFFFRPDLLAALLAARPRIWLYTGPESYAAGGGVGGGCYSPGEGAIKLALARLYEGLRGPAPGVAPLLHELGHMLDCLDITDGTLGPATGLYPGLRPADGPAYTPEARQLFAEGKAVEAARYRRRAAGERGGEPPFGHPYVFQSDGEFLAGYLELFLRCPNAFAAHCPALYAGYVALFRQDPRRAWPSDFTFYLDDNRRFYASGQRPPPDGLTLPAAA